MACRPEVRSSRSLGAAPTTRARTSARRHRARASRAVGSLEVKPRTPGGQYRSRDEHAYRDVVHSLNGNSDRGIATRRITALPVVVPPGVPRIEANAGA